MPHARIAQVGLGERRAYSLAEIAALTGFAISTLYKLMHTGHLQTIKIAGRRLVRREDLDRFLASDYPQGKRQVNARAGKTASAT
jgi:excisionase family DNA binding protein